ncbi:hypothetical protein U9M48_014039, partial [Paspalum notatum var. saurae]
METTRSYFLNVIGMMSIIVLVYGKMILDSRLIHTGEKLEHDPFVFSSQVVQVFYVEDPKAKGWNIV